MEINYLLEVEQQKVPLMPATKHAGFRKTATITYSSFNGD